MSSSLTLFLSMGGYAQYVWSAYGITLVILLGNVWYTRHQAHRYHKLFCSEPKP